MYRFEEFLLTIFGILALILAVWLGGMLVLHILKAMALRRMAENAGIPSPGLAWVPVANNYLLGLLCDRAVYCRTGRQWKLSVILPVLDLLGIFGGSAASFLTGWLCAGSGYPLRAGENLSVLGSGLIGLASAAVTAAALYYLFCDYEPGREVIYTVLAVVFGTLAQSVLLMVIRDRVPLSVQTGGYRPPACAGGGWGPGSGPGGPEVWWGPPPPAASGGPEARWQQPLRHAPPAGAPPENPGNPES